MRPGTLLLILLVGWALLGLPVAFGLLPVSAWWAVAAVITVLALVDLLRLRAQPRPPCSANCRKRWR